MRKLFSILNSVKVGKDEDMNIVCPLHFTMQRLSYKAVSVECRDRSQMESNKWIVDEALETINVDNSFRGS